MRVHLKALGNPLVGDLDTFVTNGGTNHEECLNEGTVFFEMPANPYHKESFDNHPNIQSGTRSAKRRLTPC